VQVLLTSGFLTRGPASQDGGTISHATLQSTIDAHSSHGNEDDLVKSMLVAGLFPNITVVSRRGRRPPTRFTNEDGKVAFHPSSLLANADEIGRECVTFFFLAIIAP
jgi:hypothetical protein